MWEYFREEMLEHLAGIVENSTVKDDIQAADRERALLIIYRMKGYVQAMESQEKEEKA